MPLLSQAVGTGGEDFKAAMVKCVEDVVGGSAPVSTRESSGGNYLSVRVGPVRVESPEQVREGRRRRPGEDCENDERYGADGG